MTKNHTKVGCMQVRDGEANNLKACIESAAVLEMRLTAVEWSQIALVALQGTQVGAHTTVHGVDAASKILHSTFSKTAVFMAK
jgi:uncharacterized membrane protein